MGANKTDKKRDINSDKYKEAAAGAEAQAEAGAGTGAQAGGAGARDPEGFRAQAGAGPQETEGAGAQAGAGAGTQPDAGGAGAKEAEGAGAQADAGAGVQPEAGGAGQAGPAAEEELNTRYMRLAADFQNYKRRVEKEKKEIYAYANEKIMASLLEVADNFERALSAGAEASEEGFAKGMELIFRQLLDLLTKNGLEEIDCQGADFDPAVHHAVMMEEAEGYESGKVTGVLKKGYRLNDKVIRPAMVKVAQ